MLKFLIRYVHVCFLVIIKFFGKLFLLEKTNKLILKKQRVLFAQILLFLTVLSLRLKWIK